MELTREMIATIAKQYKREQDYYYAGMKIDNLTGLLAEALLAKLDEPSVWDGSPEDCTACTVNFIKHMRAVSSRAYTRELPKSRIDEIAEEACTSILMRSAPTNDFIESTVKQALLKYKDELEAGR